MRIYFTLLFLFFLTTLSALERPEGSPYVYPAGILKEGVYLSFEEFFNNAPSVPIEAVMIKEADSNAYHLTLAAFKINGEDVRHYKKIWGICLDGIPYINYKGRKDERTYGINTHSVLGKPDKSDPVIFYRLDVLGKVCLFPLEHIHKSGMPRSYSNYIVPLSIQVVKQKAMDAQTGMISDLTPGYVWDVIKDDAFLLEMFNSGIAGINLVQFIELYNQRNPLSPTAETN